MNLITENCMEVLRLLVEHKELSNRNLMKYTDFNVTSLWRATNYLEEKALVIKSKGQGRGSPVVFKITPFGEKLSDMLTELDA